MNRGRFTEHRIPTSLSKHVGESATDQAVLEALVRKAREAGVVVFLKTELEKLPPMSKALIESEHRRLLRKEIDP